MAAQSVLSRAHWQCPLCRRAHCVTTLRDLRPQGHDFGGVASVPVPSRKSTRLNPYSQRPSYALKSMSLTCAFPSRAAPGAIEITHEEISRLENPMEFLNDTVIDAYMNRCGIAATSTRPWQVIPLALPFIPIL